MDLRLLTNIPTPYRTHLFNLISAELDSHDHNFEVYYMARTERGRFWKFSNFNSLYSYKFLPGITIYLRKIAFHINPFILPMVSKRDTSIILLAGSWNSPTVLFVVLYSKVLGLKNVGFWSEGNLDDEYYSKNSVFGIVKKWVYKSMKFFVVSGERAELLVRKYNFHAPSFTLPNVIDDSKFHLAPKNLAFYKSDKRVVLIIAKLNDRKNVFGYLKAIKGIITDRLSIRIAGTGEDHSIIKNWIDNNGLTKSITLLGQIGEAEIINEMSRCHLFCLPSLRDPYPISLIEAIHMSCPLLVSNKVGSLPEILRDNGLSFDPSVASDMAAVTESAVNSTPDMLYGFGIKSWKLANEVFNSRLRVSRFIMELDDVLSSNDDQAI